MDLRSSVETTAAVTMYLLSKAKQSQAIGGRIANNRNTIKGRTA
jgi:hypothetical protein